ncbi:hypothetical protein B6U45_10380, partial [Ligilactobacillus salivarius]
MDKEELKKLKELRNFMLINDIVNDLTKQNKNLESLTNRNTGMILKRLERIQ